MKKIRIATAAAFASALVLTSCIDDNYDLSDINTLSRIPVDNLTLPINVKPVVLDDVLDIDDNENIETVTVNGKKFYALSRGGEVNSDRVYISPVSIDAPHIDPSELTLSGESVLNRSLAGRRRISAQDLKMRYKLHDALVSTYTLESGEIDHSLESLESFETFGDITLTVRLQIPAAIARMASVKFENIHLQLPKGLENSDGETPFFSLGKGKASYDSKSGIVVLDGDMAFDNNGTLNISMGVDRLNLKTAGVSLGDDHHFRYHGEIGILAGGDIVLTPTGNLEELPASMKLSANYGISTFSLKNFTGRVNYPVEGLDINPIDLTDLPEFLSDPETSIVLDDAEILLGVTNTASPYHIGTDKIKIELVSEFAGGSDKNDVWSEGFEIPGDKNNLSKELRYNVVLCEEEANAIPVKDFNDPLPKWIKFQGLNNILRYPDLSAPKGLPKTIDVNLSGVCFKGNAVKFPIRRSMNSEEGTIAPLAGEYRFFAPLSFGPDSKIVYNKVEDDLGGEDIEDLNITVMRLTAHAVSTLPLDVTLYVYPLDRNGKKLGECVSPLNLSKGGSGDVVFEIVGTAENPIRGLDGVQYIAVVDNPDPNEAIAPDQTVTLSGIRITVSGYYEKEF